MSSNGARPASRHGAARHLQGGGPASRPRTAWRVIHACEYARDVLPVVEGQIAAGMRPYIVTPQGAGSAELYLARPNQEQARSFSLLRSWQDVRNWRKSILECDPETSADLVHAHAFAAGMAAVRSCGCVVYDLTGCIEELAIAAASLRTGQLDGTVISCGGAVHPLACVRCGGPFQWNERGSAGTGRRSGQHLCDSRAAHHP